MSAYVLASSCLLHPLCGKKPACTLRIPTAFLQRLERSRFQTAATRSDDTRCDQSIDKFDVCARVYARKRPRALCERACVDARA
jgi:hypothetical protein